MTIIGETCPSASGQKFGLGAHVALVATLGGENVAPPPLKPS